MKLGEVAVVRSGLVLSRKQSRESTSYKYKLLNLRSIKEDGSIDLSQLDVFDAIETLSAEYVSHVGDVIVRLSAPYTAVLIDEMTENMVISSNFVIIRANKRFLMPEYIFWLLNTQKVKRQIYENTSSNMLGAIKAKYFSEFALSPLPLEKQEKIAALNILARKEVHLSRALAEQKEILYADYIDRVQKQMRRGNKQ